MEWNGIISRVEHYPGGDGPTWASEKATVALVLNKAKDMGISPETVENTTISNLRIIAAQAKTFAIRNQKDELEKLLKQAASMVSKDLRIYMGKKREAVQVTNMDGICTITVYKDQADVIVKNLRERFEFTETTVRKSGDWKKYRRGLTTVT